MSNDFVVISLAIEDTLRSACDTLRVMKSRSADINEITRMAVDIADIEAQIAQERAKRIAHMHSTRVIRAPTADEVTEVRASMTCVETFSTASGQGVALVELVGSLVKLWNDANH